LNYNVFVEEMIEVSNRKVLLVLHYISIINMRILVISVLVLIQNFTISYILPFSDVTKLIIFIIVALFLSERYVKYDSPYSKRFKSNH